MNITKAFVSSIALFGASNMQAITNSDFVIQQDNPKINNYQTNRPEASKRLFVSQAVEQQIAHIKQLLTNARLAWMFEKLFPEHPGYYCSFLTAKMIRLFIQATSTPCGCAIRVHKYGLTYNSPTKTRN